MFYFPWMYAYGKTKSFNMVQLNFLWHYLSHLVNKPCHLLTLFMLHERLGSPECWWDQEKVLGRLQKMRQHEIHSSVHYWEVMTVCNKAVHLEKQDHFFQKIFSTTDQPVSAAKLLQFDLPQQVTLIIFGIIFLFPVLFQSLTSSDPLPVRFFSCVLACPTLICCTCISLPSLSQCI